MINPERSRQCVETARRFFEQAQYGEAVKALVQAQGQDPVVANADFYLLRGKSYQQLKKYREAVDDYSQAVLFDADDRVVCELLFSALKESGHIQADTDKSSLFDCWRRNGVRDLELRPGFHIFTGLWLFGAGFAPRWVIPMFVGRLQNANLAGIAAASAELSVLGQCGSEAAAAIPALERLVRSCDAARGDILAAGLGRDARQALERIRGTPVLGADAPTGEDAQREFRKQLNSLNRVGWSNARIKAATYFGNLGPQAAGAIPALIDALNAGRTELSGEHFYGHRMTWEAAPLREAAAIALGTIGTADANRCKKALRERLSDQSERVRLRAVESLCMLGEPPAEFVALLIPLIKSDKSEISAAAISALGNIGPAAITSVDEIEGKTYKSLYPHLRAVQALPKIRREITQRREDLKIELVNYVVGTLTEIGGRDADHRKRCAEIIGELGAEVRDATVPALIEALWMDFWIPVRQAAQAALERVAPEEAAGQRDAASSCFRFLRPG